MFFRHTEPPGAILLSGLVAVLLPVAVCALTPEKVLTEAAKMRGEVTSYTAKGTEAGDIGGYVFSSDFAITWVKDGRFILSSEFRVPGRPGPFLMKAWFDGDGVFVESESRGFKRYAKLDFSELPAGDPFPSREFIGGIFNPVTLCRFDPKGLADYQMDVLEAENLLGTETYLLRARLKAGVKPKTITSGGKVVPAQAQEVLIWYGKDDGMMRKVLLRVGDHPIYTWALTSLELNPSVTGEDLAPVIPEGAEVFDVTGEFRSARRALQKGTESQ